MNWRQGFARVARITAICYGILSVVVVCTVFWESRSDAMRDYRPIGPWSAFQLPSSDPYAGIARAPSPAQLAEQTKTANRMGLFAAALAVAWMAAIYAVLWAVCRAVRWVVNGFTAPA